MPRLTGVIWLAWLLTLLGMVGLSVSGVLHPSFLWMAIPLGIQVLATLILLGAGLWRLARGPQRGRAARWMVWGLLPTLAMAAYLEDLLLVAAERNHPVTFLVRWALPVASLLGEPYVRLRYPYRFEEERFVMWSDQPSPDPQEMAAMDAHLHRLETALGEHTETKVYWVRGPVWGLEGRYTLGWALGAPSTAEARFGDDLTYVDRHEVAHFVLCQFVSELAIPAILNEGWAEYHSARSPEKRWEQTWWAHHDGTLLSLRELTNPAWYHNSDGPVYWQGSVLVDYLLRRFGYPKFLELCRNCHEATFAEDLQRTLGLTLDELDQAYQEELVAQGPPNRHFLRSARLGPNVSADRWNRFVDNYCAGRQHLQDLFLHSSVTAFQTFQNNTEDGATTAKEQRTDYFLDHPRRATVMHFPQVVEARVHTPDYDFSAHRAPDNEAWKMTYFCRRTPQEKGRDTSEDHREPLFLTEIDPLRSWELVPDLRITGLDEEESSGSRTRVSFEICNRFTTAPTGEHGWWLFDPSHDFALVERKREIFGKDSPPPLVWHQTVEYRPIDDRYVPVLVQNRCGKGETVGVMGTLRVESCTFGPPSDPFFKQATSGSWPATATLSPPGKPRPFLAWIAGGNLLLALVFVLGPMRRRLGSQAATSSSSGESSS